jgi:IclR family transcriptional regulator, KDG regulon repressor
MKQEIDKYLSKVIKIMEVFLDNKTELNINEISNLSGLNKLTCSQIASALEKHNYLVRQGKRGSYSLGTIFMAYYYAITSKYRFRNIALKHLSLLSHQLKELTLIAYPTGLDEAVPEIVEDESVNEHSLKVNLNLGAKFSLNATSLGKVILGNLTEKELEYYFENKEIIQYTPNTITDINIMKSHLAAVRHDSIAFDDEESNLGIGSVAAGVKNGDGKLIAVISVVAPTIRLTRAKLREVAPIVKGQAVEISKESGLKSL